MSDVRVVVTGIGLVTPVGHDTPSSWRSILAGKSGAGPIRQFDEALSSVRFACEVHDWMPEKLLPHKLLREMDRFTEFAVVAADEAIRDAGLSLAEHEEARAGVIVGTGVGGIATIEAAARKLADKPGAKLSPYVIPAVSGNLAGGQISIRHRLKGPSYCAMSACATGAHAIGEAGEWIARGRADVMIAGSAEAPITPVAMGGFAAMRALSKRSEDPTRASRPFDRGRDGFVAGEGAGILVLESLERARRRGARIYAELTGYGASSDAFHICAPPENGEGSARSMRMALEDAGLSASDIAYVNAHATSTPLGDLAEARSILDVFGAHATDRKLAVSSTKSMTGHTLGAAGSIEAAFSVLAVAGGIAPPTINLDDLDPEVRIEVVGAEPRRMPIRHALSNAFGFGGANASLIFSAVCARAGFSAF